MRSLLALYSIALLITRVWAITSSCPGTCAMLLAEDSSFMENCGKFVSALMMESMITDCTEFEESGHFEDFLNNMHLICDAKNQPFVDPGCPYDICHLIFLPTSDFMQKCGYMFSSEMLQTMRDDCYEHRCEGWYEWNIELICRQKMAAEFVWPPCEPCILYPYGEINGDTLGPVSDDRVFNFPLEWWMKFSGIHFQHFYLCENGILSFTTDPGLLEAHWCDYHPTPSISLYGLLPLWLDNDVGIGDAHVWYRTTTNPGLLDMATDTVRDNFGDACSEDFKAENLLIVTFHILRPYAFEEPWRSEVTFPDPAMNTYQVVFINGGTFQPATIPDAFVGEAGDMYTLTLYERLDWIVGWTNDAAVVGIGDGGTERIPHPPHEGYSSMQLLSDSNINMPGCWLYKVSDDPMKDPQCTPIN